MSPHVNVRKSSAPIIWSACLFAAAYWLLDAGSALWTHSSTFAGAFVPEGWQFYNRLLFAAVFAVAGSIAGAAVQRGRDVEEFALGKLRESDRKYDALLASSFDCAVTLDASARVLEISQSAAALFGKPRQELVGCPIDDLVHIDAGDKDASATLSTKLGRVSRRPGNVIAVTATGPQGQRFPAEVRVTPMPGHASCAWVLAIREMTSTVVAQKALKHSERRYRVLFDNIPDGVFRSRPDGSILAANPAMVRLLGYDNAEDAIANANMRDFYADPAQRTKVLGILERAGEVRNLELKTRGPDGTPTAVLANVRAVFSDNNEDVVYEGTITDISDTLAARDALADSEERFRAVFDNALDMIAVIDAAGKIVYSSPSTARFAGRKPDEQVGLLLFRNAHPEDIASIRKIIRTGFARPGTPQKFTCRVYDKDGQLRRIEAIGTAYLTRHGDLRAVVNARDITDRVATEAQLREMQKVQVVGRLTNGIAHEFNNLLTVVSSNLEVLDERIQDDTLLPHVTSAMHACQQGCDLTRRLMAFADHRDMEAVETSVNGVIADLEPVLRRSLRHSVDIEIDTASDLWDVKVDPVQLEGALLQLAVNANDALADDGELTITSRNLRANDADNVLESDCIRISMRDNGNGMSRKVLERVTEPFFSTSDAPGRTGLGLSVVRSFADSAGGKLVIESERGIGTKVHLYLPRANSRDAAVKRARSTPVGNERVLVVDDNVDVRNAATALLQRLGYGVLQADSGDAALELLDSEDVQLLFTDLAMPRMSGIELAANARARHPNLKVLLTSGNEAATAEASDRLDPNYELIRKPYKKQALAEHVRQALDTQL